MSHNLLADLVESGLLKMGNFGRMDGKLGKMSQLLTTEVETLLGDPTKAKQKLGWVPEITAQEMCAEMVAFDLADAKKHALLKHHGYSVNVSVE